MTNHVRGKPVIPPVVAPVTDWCAEQISNPVLRLRFLQSAALRRRQSTWRSSRPFHWRLLLSLLAVLLLFTTPSATRHAGAANTIPPQRVVPPPRAETVRMEQIPEIWQVEKTQAFETYSNGLRIDTRFSVSNRRRSYLAFSAARPDDTRGERLSVPAGIVFHTTESLQAPFEAAQNATLERIGEALLAYVRMKRAYNFLIDRFGRVYRVVEESDAANHAGFSIWADSERVYLNLNESFLAVSFETRTLPGQTEATVNPAQIRSAAMLTDMLRKRYGIAADNCVTHAQVSVNASSLRIGYHLDWASSFPFGQIGLPDNYALPLPSVLLFGLEYDPNFIRRAGARLYGEAQLADRELRDDAGADGQSVLSYRRILQQRYRNRLAAVHGDVHREASHVEEEE